VGIRDSGQSVVSRVGRPRSASRSAGAAAFVVRYDAGFLANPAALAAFQAAVTIWSGQLTSTTPIVVDASWTVLPAGVLGAAGPAYLTDNFAGAPLADTWYAAALANKLAGRDLYPDRADITATFSSSASWYFGLDGQTPAGQSDFVSVALHELGHGLGFAGTGAYVGGIGSWGLGSPTKPAVYDRYVVDGAGASILTFVNGSVALGAVYTGNGLGWGGPQAVAANGGARPRLHAPAVWSEGSSYSHLDEAVYPAGDANSLMTPAIARGESVHDPGPIAGGIFADMGWTEPGAVATPTRTPTPPAAVPSPTIGAGLATPTVTPGVPTAVPGSPRVFLPGVPRGAAG
jgi:hypothetical protein